LGIDDLPVIMSGEQSGTIRPMKGLDIVVKSVCVRCNTGWLSDLESRTGDLLTTAIQGNRVVFLPEDQHLAATWATKTALLLELALEGPRGTAYSPADNAAWLYAHGEPPPGTEVWVGAVGPALTGHVWLSSSTGFRRADDGSEELHAYLSAMAIGHLLFQVFGEDIGSDMQIKLGPIPKTFLKQIWPVSADRVLWPTAPLIQAADLSRIWPLQPVTPP